MTGCCMCAGTGSDWMACPSGTYSNATGLYNVLQCLPCDAGQFCLGEHLTSPTGICTAGTEICFKIYLIDDIISYVLPTC